MQPPKRKQNRLRAFDYSEPNAYFITICTQGRKKIFWTDVGAIIDRPENVPLTEVGEITERCILNIPHHYPMISVDRYVIMPNHIHLLLQIHTDSDGRSVIAPTIATVVRHMKGAATKEIGCSVWQKGFYDHVVRGEKDYLEIWNYIEGNPGKWSEDELFAGDQ